MKKESKGTLNKLEKAYAFVLNKHTDWSRTFSPKLLRKSKSKHPYEYIRGYFGPNSDETEIMNNVKTLLTGIGVSLNDIELEYGKYGTIVSGTYYAIKITSKSEAIDIDEFAFNLPKKDEGSLYIINTVKGSSKIKQKSLTPNKLGLCNKPHSNTDSIIQSVTNALEQLKLAEYKPVLINLCNTIIDAGKHNLSLDDIFNTKVFDISYKVDITDKPEFNSLTAEDLNNISNDFGEVLGPIMLLSELQIQHPNDVVISYPETENNQDFDYTINSLKTEGINIAAKANSGSSSSIISIMNKIDTFYNKEDNKGNKAINDIKPNSKDWFFLTTIVSRLANISTSNKKGGSYVRANTWGLAKELMHIFKDSRLSKGINVLLNAFNCTIEDLEDKNKLYKKVESFLETSEGHENFINILANYYSEIGYTPSHKNAIELLKSKSKLNDLKSSKSFKEGLIIYPIKVEISNLLNCEYGDCIKNYVSQLADGYQLTLTMSKASNIVNMNFKMMLRKTANYNITPGGYVSDPLNKNIGIKYVLSK